MKQPNFRAVIALSLFIVMLIFVAMSLSFGLSNEDEYLRQRATMFASIALILVVLLLYLFSRWLLLPMRQTAALLTSIRNGEMVDDLSKARRGELGELGRAIDGMLGAMRERSQQSEDSRAKLQALFSVVQEGIVITDQYGIIESVNPSLCAMFGYEAEELLGQSNLLLMPEPYASNHDSYMRDSVRTGTLGFMGMYRDLTAKRKDGSIFPVVINVETLSLEDNTLFAAIIRDITKDKERETELLNAKMRAEMANEAKSNFLSMMSHEIRTPLNGVMGVLQLIEADVQDPEMREFLKVASHSASNLLHIVNDILDISKAESGAMELDLQVFNLRELLEESMELYMTKLVDANIVMRYFLPMDMPYLLVGDPFRLQQMINNLLSNALKFTNQGEIQLLVNWEADDESGIDVRIDITDTGIGIAKEKLITIFEPFVQADSAISRSHGGTGLGLSIVKRLASLMGGRIWATSEPGKGSHFHLFLRFPVAEQLDPAASGRLAGYKILYCGERREKSMLLDYLDYHQADVKFIELQALADPGPFIKQDIRLIIFDSDAPSIVEGMNRFAENESTQDIRILCVREFISSNQPKLHKRILDTHEPVLIRSLDGLFSEIEQRPSFELSQSTHAENQEMSTNRILLVEDNPVNQMVAKSMLSKMGYEVDIANNGQEAVESVREGNVDLVLMDCHMPIMDGFEATMKIRELLDGRTLPIVAMTADASISDRDRCINAGMDDHLAKPIKIEILQSTIVKWLQASK